MKATQFEKVTLTFLLKGKKRSIVDCLSHVFDPSENQVWIAEDRLLLNAMFHLLTSNIQPTSGKVIHPIRKYYAIKPVPMLNHFSLKQYIKILLAIITPGNVDSKKLFSLLCQHHHISPQELGEVVEYLPIETQIALALSLAILLDTSFVFIQNAYLHIVLDLLPKSLHEQWQQFLTKNVVISVVYNEKEPIIHPDFKRILNLKSNAIIETLRAS